jgi:hypothetical protein
MKRKTKFVFIVCVVVAICSLASHMAIGWLKIRAEWGNHKAFASPEFTSTALLHSSSPGYDAIDWEQVAKQLGENIEGWGTPGSSPSEWEIVHTRSTAPSRVFIAFSAYDLNENFLCDFRANIVPLAQTVRDLRATSASWPFSKKLLTQYVVTSVRRLFPTVGRSDGVMVGVRANLQRIAGRNIDAGEAPQFARTGGPTAERLSDWDEARLQRKLLLLRAATGDHFFDGPKRLALMRLLKRANEEGPVVLVVLPNSPAYRQSLMPAAAMQAFEEEVASLQRTFPQVPILRLDRYSALEHNQYFSDLVHMNKFGQQIATQQFLSQLQNSMSGEQLARGNDLR